MVPRGIRNANPGNIRRSSILWQGEAELQPDDEFITFKGPEWGLRAIAKILSTYQASGLNTVRQMINRWAPPVENDTGAYVLAVADVLQVKPDAPVEISDPVIAEAMLRAIVTHENGEQPYSDETYKLALSLAGLRIA